MSHLTIATTQMPCTWDLPRNLDQAEHWCVRPPRRARR